VLTDGVTSEIGAQPNNCTYLGTAWGIDDVGLFVRVNETNRTLQKSPDGISPFVTIKINGTAIDAGTSLERSLVDCGRHLVSDGLGGIVEKRVLLYFARFIPPNLGTDHVYVSVTENDADAGNNGTWTDLFGKTLPAIGHCHGGVYIKGKGLYVMTGDADKASSILFCAEADIGSLVDNPDTWYSRWALGANDRASWSGTVKTDYILAGNAQDWRTVDFVTANNRYAYFMPDAQPINLINHNGSQRIYKVDLYDTNDSAAGTITLLKGDGILNYGWYGGVSKSGLIYLTTAPYSGATTWLEGCNDTLEVYCIDSNTDEVKVVKRIPAAPNPPFASLANFCILSRLIEFGGSMMANLDRYFISPQDSSGDRWNYSLLCGKVLEQNEPDTNSIPPNIITATTLADTLYPSTIYSSTRNRMVFNSGRSVIAPGNTIKGGTSGATAKLTMTPVTIMTNPGWGGTTTGDFQLTDINGVFKEGEDILVGVNQTPSAKIVGFTTWEIVDSTKVPAGWNGEAVRYASVAKSLPLATGLLLKLSNAQTADLEGEFVTFSCKVWIHPDTDTGTNKTTSLRPYFYFQVRPFEWTAGRAYRSALKKGEWITVYGSTFVKRGATIQNYFFYPDGSVNSGNTVLIYIADFQLVKGTIPNNQE
jgi:hypothetical protein